MPIYIVCLHFSCVVGRGCLLWLVCSLGKTLLTFALFYFVLQGPTYLMLQVSPDFLLLYASPLWWKGHLFWMLALESLVDLLRAAQCQLLQHLPLGHRLGLLWYWMVCFGNGQSFFVLFFRLHPSDAFRLFCTMTVTPFLLRDSYPQ